MDQKDFQFTGHTSSDAGGSDIDNLSGYFQAAAGADYSSLGQLGNDSSEADRAVRSACRQIAGAQGGTNFDDRMGELKRDCPGQLQAPDIADPADYIDSMYPTCGEYQQRQWNAEDNTGGDGVPAPEMPVLIEMKPKPRKPY